VATYFYKLLKCYSKAEEHGTARTMPTMSVEQFKNLAPVECGVAMRQPLVLVGSPPKKPISNHDR